MTSVSGILSCRLFLIVFSSVIMIMIHYITFVYFVNVSHAHIFVTETAVPVPRTCRFDFQLGVNLYSTSVPDICTRSLPNTGICNSGNFDIAILGSHF